MDIYNKINRHNDIDKLVNFFVNLVSKILHIYVNKNRYI